MACGPQAGNAVAVSGQVPRPLSYLPAAARLVEGTVRGVLSWPWTFLDSGARWEKPQSINFEPEHEISARSVGAKGPNG